MARGGRRAINSAESLLWALTSTPWELYILILTVTTVRDVHDSIRAVLKRRTGEVTSPLQGGMVG